MATKQKKVLAVASAGGHWVQLLRLRPAFEGASVEYMSTAQFNTDELNAPLHVVTDANLSEKLKTIKMFAQVLWVIIKTRPDVIISTGAAPGFAAIMFGRLLGMRTMWLDSIANSEELSKSGKMAKPWADAWLTQWSNLSSKTGPSWWGAVL